ncbi:Na+:solute symporter [Peribacillus muralis]|uniref:sodium:solute symporter family protein n=1 Tax=Peribacillus muralis TaxID=264697 RepID=UPI001F4D41E8|nr:sodium:solute symporter family protein [Peribacillus muralis]MCK1993576.1 Na+:solute symporter [Peribacillus muralis]MCK2014136.1 Na+:solute symporter [Peribacillus muralis]
MQLLDWIIIGMFFLIMLGIGLWSFRKVKGSKDFFVAGGNLPWWLSGISHHVSGHSGAVFVAYAALAYTHGFSLYIWWALPIFIACFVGAFTIAPRWSRLRSNFNIESPTEYLAIRYNVPTQQVMAWSGVLLKLFDVGAKWAAIGILLNAFTGISVTTGILISGGISLIYITIGGIWADVWTDFAQFGVQVAAGIAMFVIVLGKLGGINSIFTMWNDLPKQNSELFNEPYTFGYALAFLIIAFFSYNGGTWNLATRFISSQSGTEARKSALLSASLYLIWPLILFFPMWAAPILIPNIEDPTQSYAMLTQQFLPVGFVGLVLASLFAATMSMTSSDSNTIASVITRDILPVIAPKFKNISQKQSLKVARISTLLFIFLTLILAIYSDVFGGVLGLLISWFAALVGPISIPMLLGLFPLFRHCDSKAAIISIASGLATFAFINTLKEVALSVEIGTPIIVSLLSFTVVGFLNRKKEIAPEIVDLLNSISKDSPAEISDSQKRITL